MRDNSVSEVLVSTLSAKAAVESGRKPAPPAAAPQAERAPAPAGATGAAAAANSANSAYVLLPRLIERMHRRYLDVLRFELTRIGVDDLNPVQMMQLLNIDEEVSVQELVDRGHYVGSSAFYNIKKLVQAGYIEQSRSPSDRRAVRVRLTKKAHDLCAKLREQQDALAASFAKIDEKGTDIEGAYKTLRSLERSWDDYLRYGKY
jgi:MarR family transcriptional regulator, exopolysaccharide II synthesis transcriptional activator